MPKKIRAVLLDYGNVLCPMPQPSEFDRLGNAAGIESPRFLESLWRYRLDYDRGTLDSPSYWRRIAEEHALSFSDEQIGKLVETDIALWINPSASMLEWVRALRSTGVKTAILSNMPTDHSNYLRGNASWLAEFDHHVFSGELGVVKPHAEIYQACLRGLGVGAEESLFIDDLTVNVEAARALGIESIKFESIAQLAVDVQQFELPAPLVEAKSASA